MEKQPPYHEKPSLPSHGAAETSHRCNQSVVENPKRNRNCVAEPYKHAIEEKCYHIIQLKRR
jgi:hypothetical protein